MWNTRTNDPIEERGKLIFLSIDQEKAFEKTEHAHIQSLEILNFCKSFKKWITILYTDIKSQLYINGHPTDVFQITRSARQAELQTGLLCAYRYCIYFDIKEDTKRCSLRKI